MIDSVKQECPGVGEKYCDFVIFILQLNWQVGNKGCGVASGWPWPSVHAACDAAAPCKQNYICV